jgi:hypothetical protein
MRGFLLPILYVFIFNTYKMSTFTPAQLSSYRKQFRTLIQNLERLSSRCLFADPLIRAKPQEVWRTCGKKTCRCAKGGENRHGPYRVLSVTRQGKQRQVPLSKEKHDLWDLAVHYQFQVNKLSELKGVCREIEALVEQIIEKRIREFP